MIKKPSRKIKKNFRHKRIRKKVFGTEKVPRVAVFKSSKNIYAQIIDDTNKTTVLHASTLTPKVAELIKGMKKNVSTKIDAASCVGKVLAELAKEAGFKTVRFDRGGYPYHGRVKALAEALKEGGLVF
jgi:large subunit ribosomal protein L18